MTAEQTAADLRAAAEVLLRDGWCQFRSHASTGEHCAAGAMEAAVDPDWRCSDGWVDDQNIRFGSAVAALENRLSINVTTWNDHPGRTAEEVIAALLSAADQTEATS